MVKERLEEFYIVTAKLKKDKGKGRASTSASKKVSKKKVAKKISKKSTTAKSIAKRAKKITTTGSKPTPYEQQKGEEYMNEKQLAHFKLMLENWRKELMEEVDQTISEMQEATVLADPNDRATREEFVNLELRTRDRERKLLKKIEDAIQQIDDNEYGYCESCGVEIGIRRLEARPTATMCIDCKTIAEIKEKRA